MMENTNEADKAAQQENVQPGIPFQPYPTIYKLRELIERCFEEARKAGMIQVTAGAIVSELPDHLVVTKTLNTGDSPIQAQLIADERKLADHISLTIIGELQELEIIRKLAPMFRMFHQLDNDFHLLDQAQAEDYKMRNIRMAP